MRQRGRASKSQLLFQAKSLTYAPMSLKDYLKRRSEITDEPMRIDPQLLGRALASPQRRGAALLFDLTIWFISAVSIMLLITLLALYIAYPAIYQTVINTITKASDEQGKSVDYTEVTIEVVRLFASKNPQAISPELKRALESDDEAELKALLDDYTLLFSINFGSDKKSEIDYQAKKITAMPDLFFGGLNFVLNLGGVFLFYFTFFTWILKGRTPGKWLFGIRVVRLDGRPIGLWDAFGRAGGYSASLSTLGLGFLEAIWHPNRQTVHDRISGTVVIRGR